MAVVLPKRLPDRDATKARLARTKRLPVAGSGTTAPGAKAKPRRFHERACERRRANYQNA